MSGKITIWDMVGRRTVTGPMLIESKAGTQRAGYAHTDIVCMNMHGCAEATPPSDYESEEYFTVETQEAYALEMLDVVEIQTISEITHLE